MKAWKRKDVMNIAASLSDATETVITLNCSDIHQRHWHQVGYQTMSAD